MRRRQQGDPVWRCGPWAQDRLVDPDTPLGPGPLPALRLGILATALRYELMSAYSVLGLRLHAFHLSSEHGEAGIIGPIS